LTLIIGFVGEDGALIAADSQASEADQTRHTVEKIWSSGGLVFGYSGYDAVRYPLKVAIEQIAASLAEASDHLEAKRLLCDAIKPVLEQVYGAFVAYHPLQTPAMIAGALLVIGRDEGGYWLLEIDANNNGTFYTDRGFHAVGSGATAAQVARAFLEHYEPRGRSLSDLRLLAVRTLGTCIAVLASGLAEPIQLWTSTDGSTFQKVAEEDLLALENNVQQWITVECESLDTSPETGSGEAMPPLPEQARESPSAGEN
jgi:20S proteasome alpha/beta subunit